MFITRECDYAVRVIRALSESSKLSVSEICEKEILTAPFAYKILKKLQKAGIVKGYRGVHGGYSLLMTLEELTLLAVYRAIDPELYIIECLNPAKKCELDGRNGSSCLIHTELEQVQAEVMKLLSRKSLEEVFFGTAGTAEA